MTKSIRLQIILFFMAISLISSAIVSISNYWEAKKLLNEGFDRELSDTASLISAGIEGNLRDAREAVSAFVKDERVRSLDPEKTGEISRLFIDFVNIFYNIYVYDREGNLVSVVYYGDEDVKEGRIHRKNFRTLRDEFYDVATRVLNDGKARFTDTFSNRDRLLTAYVAPIPGDSDDKARGLVSCGIFVNNPKLLSMLKSLVPPYSGFICILDGSGNIYGQQGNIPGNIGSFSMRELGVGSGKKRSSLHLGGGTFRFAINEIRDAHLYVLVAMGEKDMKSILASLASEVIILNCISLLLAIGVSVIVANFLVQPVNRLVEGLREVGRGNYSYAITTRSYGELNEAIDSYNEMISKLQKNRMIENLWNESWSREMEDES